MLTEAIRQEVTEYEWIPSTLPFVISLRKREVFVVHGFTEFWGTFFVVSCLTVRQRERQTERKTDREKEIERREGGEAE
jgi:hypothetical protein